MYTEVTYNNAVVRVFIQLLQDLINEKRQPLSPQEGLDMLPTCLNRSTCIKESSTEDGKIVMMIIYNFTTHRHVTGILEYSFFAINFKP